MIKIKNVIYGSPACLAGVKNGDFLSGINGHDIKDVLDYMYYASEENISLKIVRDGQELIFDIVKDEYDELGIESDTFLMDKKQRCSNKCIFCFIDQMPPNMRETLYFKDDDARLSFLHGNYVTLTNLEQPDIDRIIAMKLNINVSVHTTNPELRVKMMHNKFAGEKLKYLRQMTENGIRLNCQIVCCPEINDGDELRRTLNDLGNLMPNIDSIAVVPVGITKFRDGLFPLKIFDRKSAGETIDIISEFQEKFLEKSGTRTVFPSDEFFLIAEREIPESCYYEDYPQYENGVGMLRSLIDEFTDALESAEWEGGKRHVSIATGFAPYNVMCRLAEMAENKFPQLECNVFRIRNDFFGETITVTGLITAKDLISQLNNKVLGSELIISSAMLMADSEIFLDNLTVEDVSRELNVKVRYTANDGYELLDTIIGINQNTHREENLPCHYR